MLKSMFRFCKDESGAVTVDWVVLTAGIVGLGMVVMLPIAYNTGNSATTVANGISSTAVGYPASSP